MTCILVPFILVFSSALGKSMLTMTLITFHTFSLPISCGLYHKVFLSLIDRRKKLVPMLFQWLVLNNTLPKPVLQLLLPPNAVFKADKFVIQDIVGHGGCRNVAVPWCQVRWMKKDSRVCRCIVGMYIYRRGKKRC